MPKTESVSCGPLYEVQVFGLQALDPLRLSGSDFVSSFSLEKMCNPQLSLKKLLFQVEENYVLKANKQLQQVKEAFLQFQTAEDARFVLGLKNHPLQIQLPNCKLVQTLNFSIPTRDFATRQTLRKMGGLVDRIHLINKELEVLGAVRCEGIPRPSERFVDRIQYEALMNQWKCSRERGVSLDSTAYTILRTKKAVDLQQLHQSITQLYDEECDALIQLREFQLSGWDFEF